MSSATPLTCGTVSTCWGVDCAAAGMASSAAATAAPTTREHGNEASRVESIDRAELYR